MAGKRKRYQEPTEPPIAMGAQGTVVTGRVLDPHLPLPGPVRNVTGGARPSRAIKVAGVERYEAYMRALRLHKGDPIPALCQLTGMDEETLYAYGVSKLHNEILKEGATDRPMEKLLNDYDLTQPALMGVLREHLFGDHPAASLKAADMLREMLGSNAVGETIEDMVREALGDV